MHSFARSCSLTAALFASVSTLAIAEEADDKIIEELVVVAYPAAPQNTAYPITAPPAADSADFLRQIAGVDAGRFGGHSLEPVIRGQDNTRLTILNDGALQISAGPNRMDSPSAYATVDLVDKVVVVRGYQSVLNGPGASGGVVRFERNDPAYHDGVFIAGRVGSAYESNGDAARAFGRVSMGKDALSFNLHGSWHEADNYTDGSGNEVRTSFLDRAMGASLDWAGRDGGFVRLAYDRNRMGDALFPGAGMDSIWSKGDTWHLKGRVPVDGGFVSEARFNISHARMRHNMNNYTHRSAAMLAETQTLSATWAGELELDLAFEAPTTMAFDVRRNTRDADRFGGMTQDMLINTTAIPWPDIRTKEYGVAIEQTRALSDDVSIIWGLRYDMVRADYHRADEAPTMGMMPMTANMLYQKYYGITASPVREDHFGGLVRVEKVFTKHLSGHLAASRVARTADATERGFATPMSMNGMDASWVGNPGLKAETHNSVEAALFWQDKKLSVDLTAYATRVDDFILRDSARMQGDVLVLAPMVDVYRNVDATLMGVEASTSYKLSDYAQLNASLTYTYGKDRDTANPLPQMPPFQGHVGLSLEEGAWSLTGRMAFAFKQDRVDLNPMTGTGRDAAQTPGWVVGDVMARYKASDSVDVMVGVRNLFDATYAYHLSRANLADPVEVQVNEPGRNVFAKLVARF